ncbi:MAG: DUF1232 domain-containing protein [Thermodesulfobacteriota bacterium]|nr:DUF1232 domain-containing protein [Thermodesulfobacteriota bacterium]
MDNNLHDAQRTRKSKAYEKARSRAEAYIKSPDELRKLADDAREKASGKKGPLNEVWESLMACLRMIRAYANGSYRQVSWQSLLMIVASVVYFVMPIDLLPDFLVSLGLLDDAALLGWTIKTFKKEIDDFVAWEKRDAS